MPVRWACYVTYQHSIPSPPLPTNMAMGVCGHRTPTFVPPPPTTPTYKRRTSLRKYSCITEAMKGVLLNSVALSVPSLQVCSRGIRRASAGCMALVDYKESLLAMHSC